MTAPRIINQVVFTHTSEGVTVDIYGPAHGWYKPTIGYSASAKKPDRAEQQIGMAYCALAAVNYFRWRDGREPLMNPRRRPEMFVSAERKDNPELILGVRSAAVRAEIWGAASGWTRINYYRWQPVSDAPSTFKRVPADRESDQEHVLACARAVAGYLVEEGLLTYDETA